MRLVKSESKRQIYRDGFRILKIIVDLFKEERSLFFFSLLSVLLALIAVILMIPLFITYVHTGQVPRFPTTILSMRIMLLAFLSHGLRLYPEYGYSGPSQAETLILSLHPGAEPIKQNRRHSSTTSRML